ncbi:MAG TPA: hypothetical protein VMB85_18760 [Bryobacteraceae bacterium]|nr:hypothetical protein [Bryobacteraceae bacterium]
MDRSGRADALELFIDILKFQIEQLPPDEPLFYKLRPQRVVPLSPLLLNVLD